MITSCKCAVPDWGGAPQDAAPGGGDIYRPAFAIAATAAEPDGLGFEAIAEEAIGRSLLRRLEFLAGAGQLPQLLAPLMVRHLWGGRWRNKVVITYPALPFERLAAADDLLAGGCDAVIVEGDDESSLVVGLSHSLRNERMIAHWADCVERWSMETSPATSFDSRASGLMVRCLCDRIGILRYAGTLQPKESADPVAPLDLAPIAREAVRKLLPESSLLIEDPFLNAVRALNQPSPKIRQEPGSLITCLMSYIWSSRNDLQQAFDLSRTEGRQGFAGWFLERGLSELNLNAEFTTPVETERDAPTPDNHRRFLSAPRITPVDGTAGVNLVGYPRAEMGMGQQLRSCAAAFSTTGVPFCVKDFGFGIIASHKDDRLQHLLRSDTPYDTNIFHINADQMRLAREKLGASFFRNHYNIGYWEWELSVFPDEWLEAIDLVDEIWAPSRFIREAISKKTSKPVIHMPLAIELAESSERKGNAELRKKFGLPADAFLFLFSFDFSSFATRKNFQGCLDAFRRAFHGTGQNVGLVFKTIRHNHQTREFWKVLRAIGEDPRIHVLDCLLRQGEMRDLMTACDAFVSLHRSEGFGLGMAEAMYLGKPVVATNYSGNVDFTTSDNSCLVEYELVPVKEEEYIFPEGQVWAEPDIDNAAAHMRRLVADSSYARSIGAAGKAYIRQKHSPKAVGGLYAHRLARIGTARELLAGDHPEHPEDNHLIRDTSQKWKGLQGVLSKFASRG